MALVKCSECSSEISTEAKRCPKCGAKVRRPAGPIGMVLAGLFLVAVFSSAYESDDEARVRVANEPTPEEKAAAELAAKQYSTRAAAARIVQTAIKRSLYDPDSIKYVGLWVSDDADLVCADYRAKNAFGGMIPQTLVWRNGKAYDTTSAWNKYCANVSLNDHTPANSY